LAGEIEENDAGKRRDYRHPEWKCFMLKKCCCWVIRYASDRDDEGEKQSEATRKNGDWKLTGFASSICCDIHQFKSLCCPEGEGRLDDKETVKQARSSYNAEDDDNSREGEKREVKFVASPHKDEDPLEKPSYLKHLYLGRCYLVE
jgi:hypothetical protein